MGRAQLSMSNMHLQTLQTKHMKQSPFPAAFTWRRRAGGVSRGALAACKGRGPAPTRGVWAGKHRDVQHAAASFLPWPCRMRLTYTMRHDTDLQGLGLTKEQVLFVKEHGGGACHLSGHTSYQSACCGLNIVQPATSQTLFLSSHSCCRHRHSGGCVRCRRCCAAADWAVALGGL